MHQAVDERVDILIFPELSVDLPSLKSLQGWLTRHREPFTIVVCGSRHVRRNGRRRNLCTTLVPGSHRIEHHKFNPVFLRLATPTKPLCREHIHTSPATVTVHVVDGWSFTTLICKDLLMDDTSRILQDLQVSLTLVPAWSPKTELFEAALQKLSSFGQSVAVVANLADAHNPEAAAAIVARPTRFEGVRRVFRHRITPPALLVFSLVDC